ncbi:MAG: signal peptidase II [Verrucomicrobia bacterium]|nr:signal peptidase II [Verrucomicrobiota bacterium]
MPTEPAVPRPPAVPSGETSKTEPPKSRVERVLAYRLLLGLALAVFIADQLSKLWIVAHVPFDPMHSHRAGTDIEMVRGFFHIIHVGNTGAAWSMFSGQSVLLAALAGGTLVAIYVWRNALGLRVPLTQVCFGLLCGGIVGNLVDRVRYGHVVDFIDLHFGGYIYPTFNVADSAICVGVILYLWQSLRAPK